jgi:hypothetical protein
MLARAVTAIVDLSIWSDLAAGLLAVLRAPTRTVLVERGIVAITPGVGIQVEATATVGATVACRGLPL